MFNSHPRALAVLLASICASIGCGHDTGSGSAVKPAEGTGDSMREQCVPLGAADLRERTPACEAEAEAPAVSPTHPPGVGYLADTVALPAGVAYLTFDDGPSDWTLDFLEALATHDVRATFFVRAHSWAQQGGDVSGSYRDDEGNSIEYAEVLRQILEGGHELGNHTVDHVDLTTLSLEDAAWQLDQNEALINRALVRAGAAPRPLTLLRPPFGSPWFGRSVAPPERTQRQAEIGALLQERGVTVLWNLDSSDSVEWAQGETISRRPVNVNVEPFAPSYADKVARVETTVLQSPRVTAGEGVIVLMHDNHNATRDALPAIIDGLREQGYSFGTIEELVQSRWGRPSWQVTPGPALDDRCTPEGERGCASVSADDSAAPIEVCGRFWRAFEDAGGAERLGTALGSAQDAAADGAWSQAFERGVIQLRPAADAPCNVIVSRPP